MTRTPTPKLSPQQEAREDAELKRWCDGERTTKEVAAMMGWSYAKTDNAIRRRGLKVKKDGRL